MFPARVNIVFGRRWALTKKKHGNCPADIDHISEVQKEDQFRRNCDYRWLIQSDSRLEGVLIRNDHHPRRALSGGIPLRLESASKSDANQRWTLCFANGSPGLQQPFQIKSVRSGMYLVVDEGARLVTLQKDAPEQQWQLHDATRNAVPAFIPGKVSPRSVVEELQLEAFDGDAASAFSAPQSSPLGSFSSAGPLPAPGPDFSPVAKLFGEVVLSNALEPDPSSLFGLLQGGEQNAGQNAFDRLVQQGQPKELYIKRAGGLSEAGRNSSGPRDWGVKTHFDPRVLPGHGWAPLQVLNRIWGRGSSFMHRYQARRNGRDVVWSGLDFREERPWQACGELKCQVNVPVLGWRPYQEVTRFALCYEPEAFAATFPGADGEVLVVQQAPCGLRENSFSRPWLRPKVPGPTILRAFGCSPTGAFLNKQAEGQRQAHNDFLKAFQEEADAWNKHPNAKDVKDWAEASIKKWVPESCCLGALTMTKCHVQ
ncbi:unnamed protein product [Effrenium voratum]|uniref:Uncharacterized protein n=1 Tax=Effrenium voratum TaxID=2562239 RepID=A0AA36NIU9_9DINO|nr:unnamed protein product [Effrenium voratum]